MKNTRPDRAKQAQPSENTSQNAAAEFPRLVFTKDEAFIVDKDDKGLFWLPQDRFRRLPSNDNKTKTKPDGFDFKIVSSADLEVNRKPAEFVVDGVFQRRYLVTITGPAGYGKTPIGLGLAAHIALGRPLCGHDVEQDAVLYLAGENPYDITERWLSLSRKMKFDCKTIPVDFLNDAFAMTDDAVKAVIRRAKAMRPDGYGAIILDTDAAYFPGDNESDNVERKKYAKRLRRLYEEINGGPCVIVLSHPADGQKRMNSDGMTWGGWKPRGGVAFLNEIDGNAYLYLVSKTVTLNQHQKFRGPPFKPLTFKLETYESHLLDSKGRPTTSVMAVPGTVDDQVAAIIAKGKEGKVPKKERQKILKAFVPFPDGMTLAQLIPITKIPRSTLHRYLQSLWDDQTLDFNEETKVYSVPNGTENGTD